MATSVKVVGFELIFSKNIEFGEFFQRLESKEKIKEKLGTRDVILYTDELDGYVVGLLLSYKGDKKSFITEEASHEKLAISKQKLRKGQHSSEANIFVINPESKMGLFYQYFGSISSSSFSRYLKVVHDRVKRNNIKEKKKEVKGAGKVSNEKAGKEAEIYFEGDFEFIVKATEKDIDKVLSSYQSISGVDVSVEGAIPDAHIFSPPAGYISTSSFHVGFKRNKGAAFLEQVKSHVKGIVKKVKDTERDRVLKVMGKTFSGEEMATYIGDNLECFGEMDYDRYVDFLPDDYWENYLSSMAVKNIIKIIGENDHIFGSAPNKKWKWASKKD